MVGRLTEKSLLAHLKKFPKDRISIPYEKEKRTVYENYINKVWDWKLEHKRLVLGLWKQIQEMKGITSLDENDEPIDTLISKKKVLALVGKPQ